MEEVRPTCTPPASNVISLEVETVSHYSSICVKEIEGVDQFGRNMMRSR